MAATTATALKRLIENGGLGVMTYRDAAPEDAEMPFVVVTEGISIVPDLSGDAGSEATGIENAQVDLWEQYRDEDADPPVLLESYTLAPALGRLMHGASLPEAPTHCYGVRVEGSSRTRDAIANTVRTRYSVNLYRKL